VAVSDVVNAEKCFSTLANFITTKIPQSRLASLLGDRFVDLVLISVIFTDSRSSLSPGECRGRKGRGVEEEGRE